MWVKNGTSAATNNGTTTTWNGAIAFVDQLNSTSTGGFAGYTDWRLPNFKELASIINYNKNTPTIYENYFQNIVSSNYWTSSYKFIPPAYYGDSPAWKIRLVDFNSGSVGITWNKNENHHILPVRNTSQNLQVSGLDETPVGCNLGFQDNGNDTMTDLCTNLIWTKSNLSGIGYVDPVMGGESGVYWKKAIQEAEKPRFGYSDWRLPNIGELIGISGIVSSPVSFHWSSTLDYFVPDQRWFVDFRTNKGTSNTNSKTMEYYVRLVREP